jgi:hypothetical protein
MAFDPKGKNFKERLNAMLGDAKATFRVTVRVTSLGRTFQQSQTMHVGHMFLFNYFYPSSEPANAEKNAEGNKVIAWDHFSRADLDWDGDVRWEDFLRDSGGKVCAKNDAGTAWEAGREPDKEATRKQARLLLRHLGIGKGGTAMAAPGIERCGEPCDCGRSRSRHVEGLAADLDLGDLVDALNDKKAGSLDAYLRRFGLHRPLKDLPAAQRETWHVEAIKD